MHCSYSAYVNNLFLRMTTFQKEIESELTRVREEIGRAQAVGAPALLELENSVKDVETKLALYIKRAEQPETVYGEKMKARIMNAKLDLESIQEEIKLLLIALDESVNPDQEPVGNKVDGQQAGQEEAQREEHIAQAQTLTPANDTPPAPSTDAILEAAHRIESMQKQMKLQEQERQKVAAAEERRIREEIRRKEDAKLAAEQNARAKAMEELHRAVFYGTVNHIVGSADLDRRVHLLGNRPFVIDWFANWCGP